MEVFGLGGLGIAEGGGWDDGCRRDCARELVARVESGGGLGVSQPFVQSLDGNATR